MPKFYQPNLYKFVRPKPKNRGKIIGLDFEELLKCNNICLKRSYNYKTWLTKFLKMVSIVYF